MSNKKPLINKLPTSNAPKSTPKPLINRIEGDKKQLQSKKQQQLPAGGLIEVHFRKSFATKDLYTLIPTEKASANETGFSIVKTLLSLKMLDNRKTFLEVSSTKNAEKLTLYTLTEEEIPFVSHAQILTLTTFGSKGYLLSYPNNKEVSEPFRPTIYKEESLSSAVKAFASIKTKPTVDSIGNFLLLKSLYQRLDVKYLATVASFPHKLPILMLLCHTEYYPLEELNPIRDIPAYFLKPLLLEVL